MERFLMQLKDHNTKTLETGDKQTTISLKTLDPGDVSRLAQFIDEVEVEISIKKVENSYREFGTTRDND